MKKYKLQILLPSINRYYDNNFTNEDVEAYSMTISHAGCYVFYDKDNNIIASYPIQYTIIDRVEAL